jgi:hypothetical protein
MVNNNGFTNSGGLERSDMQGHGAAGVLNEARELLSA